MHPISILILCAILAYIALRIIKKVKHKKEKYAFGVKEALFIHKLLDQKSYKGAEIALNKLASDKLRITLDYIGITYSTDEITDWQNSSKDSNLPDLAMATHMFIQGWRARSHASAEEISEDAADIFHSLLYEAKDILENIQEDTNTVLGDAANRLIAINYALSEREAMQAAYEQAIKLNPDFLWNHIYYSSGLEPKWGGSLTALMNYYNSLSEDSYIKPCIQLKLLLDSIGQEENYFGGSMEELMEDANVAIRKMDKKLTKNPIQGTDSLIVYDYIVIIAANVGNTKMMEKYMKKLKGFETIPANGWPK